MFVKKKSPKNKQAAKLKEMRKAANQGNHVTLAITKAVEREFARMHIDKVWERVEAYRAIHKDEWYHRCYLPYESGTDALFYDIPKEGSLRVDLSDIAAVVDLHARSTGEKFNHREVIDDIFNCIWTEAKFLLPIVSAWRQHKEIFTFDPDFLDNLLLSKDAIYTAGASNIITPKELETLPFPAFYVDAPIDSPIGKAAGFFFCYNSLEGHNGTDQLVFYFVNPELAENVDKLENTPMVLFNCPIQQITYDLHDEAPNTSVWECYQKDCYIAGFDSMSEEEKAEKLQHQKDAFVLLFRALQIITYLASQFADVRENQQQKKVHKRTTTIQDKPTELRKWDVGIRMGGVIRAANKQIEEVKEEKDQTEPKQRKVAGPKKPHSRRAHWQYYWYGKKDGSEVRYRRLKFVEATFVNFKEAEQLDEIPAVYHPVITF